MSSLVNFDESFLPAAEDPDIVEYFVQRGYKADVNIRAAPYDWRLAAGEHCIYTYIYITTKTKGLL